MTKEFYINFRGMIFNLIAFGLFLAEGINLWVDEYKSKAIACFIVTFIAAIFALGSWSALIKALEEITNPKTAGRILIFDGEDGDQVALGLQLSASPEEIADEHAVSLLVIDMRKGEMFKGMKNER